MPSLEENTQPPSHRYTLAIPGWLFAALAALFVTFADNRTLLANLAARADWRNVGDLWASFAIVYLVTAVSFVLLLSFEPRRLQKPLTAVYLIIAAIVAFFVDRYGVVFNENMIRNVMDTVIERNLAEATELVSVPLLSQVALFGVLPALAMFALVIKSRGAPAEIRSRIVASLVALMLGGLIVLGYSQSVIGFMNENRDLRYFITPLHAIASAEKYLRHERRRDGIPFRELGQDARIAPEHARKTVGVLIVGETERADHFSLNGYDRPTNPLLERDGVVSFTNAYSCGTATAVSVPCMFSLRGRSTFDVDSIRHESNVLDLLSRAGVGVVWIDANSGCKLVCTRVAFENLSSDDNAENDEGPEYFDARLVNAMSEHLDEPGSDMLIVLHMLGSHGPAYGRRVPSEFRVFEPSCSSNLPMSCEQSQLVNAYDNTIIYADFLIHEVIMELGNRSPEVDTFVLFVSDHGESLGEGSIYLHGLPYALAPDAQKHIPMIFWSSEEFAEHHGLRQAALAEAARRPVSHDNLAHALLGLFDVRTKLYDPALDPFAQVLPHSSP